MIWLIAMSIWVAVSAGIYLSLSRDVFRCVLGLAIFGSAANLTLFVAGRIDVMQPAVVPLGETTLVGAANSLPQALTLTAIVIGFALVCFFLALVLRLIQCAGTDDALELRMAEPLPHDPIKPPYNGAEHEPVWPGSRTSTSKEAA